MATTVAKSRPWLAAFLLNTNEDPLLKALGLLPLAPYSTKRYETEPV